MSSSSNTTRGWGSRPTSNSDQTQKFTFNPGKTVDQSQQPKLGVHDEKKKHYRFSNNNTTDKTYHSKINRSNMHNSGEDDIDTNYSPFMRPEVRERLSKHQYALDYVFRQEDLEFLEQNGYVVLKGVIDKNLCQQLVTESFERAKQLLDVDRDDHTTWSRGTIGTFHLQDIYHMPAYYEMRQSPLLYSIYAQLLGRHDLTVSLDRVCMKPPAFVNDPSMRGKRVNIDLHNSPNKIHTDLNLWYLPRQPWYQSGICLEDCPQGGGGFQVIPGMHKLAKIKEYRESFEAGVYSGGVPQRPPSASASLFQPFADKQRISREVVDVGMEQGDVVIWNSCLPHAGGTNKLSTWRLQSFIRFIPDDAHNKEYRGVVRRSALSGQKPSHFSTGNSSGAPNHWELRFCQEPPTLSWLGERVLGIAEWEKQKTW